MTNIAQQSAVYSYPLSSAPDTPGQAILRWGALVLFIVETISVGSGIVDAIMMTLRH
jgi:hypothetical protein